MKGLFYLLLILLPCSILAQQPSYFLVGEKEFEGIDIYNVIQDNANNYWFATDQGIIKHDGYSFKSVECSEMKSSSVFNFVKDKKGTVYCNNLNHQIFRIKNGVLELFFEIPDKGKGADIYLITTTKEELIIVSKEVYAIDSKGKITGSTEGIEHSYLGPPFLLANGSVVISQSVWLKTIVYKNGLFQDENLSFESNSINQGVFGLLEFYKVGKIIYAINANDKRVFKFNSNDFSLKEIDSKIIQNLKEHFRIYSVDDKLWIANGINGVNVLDEQLLPAFQKEKLYEDFFISHITQDLEGNVLLSTFDKGILVLPDPRMTDVLINQNQRLVTRLCTDQKNHIYFGTNNGEVIEVNKKGNDIISSVGNKSIETLYKWPNTPFLLTDDLGFSIVNTLTKETKRHSSYAFKSASLSKNNQLFIGTNIGVGILSFNASTDQFDFEEIHELDGRTYALQCDPKSDYLYVSSAEGVKIKAPNGKVNFLKIADTIVFGGAMTSSDNEVFLAAKKQGIMILSKGKVVRQFFPIYNDESIRFYKLIYKENKLYANTSIGLVVLDLKGNIKYILNKSIGLSTQKVIGFEIQGNTIWVSHSKGVQVMDIRKLNKSVLKPKLELSKIEVNNKIVSKDRGDEFEFSENKLSFTLKLPTLKNRENVYYHYKLIPSDTNWTINSYENNKINYNSLAPGVYRFIVKAENNGVFSKPISYSFTIQSPFYLRWWFSTFLALVFGVLITLIYRRKLRKQQLKAEQLNELNASKLTAIQSQMNPHFIFNSLNSIQDLVLKGDVTNSYTFITKFSNLVRRTLNYSDKDFIDFEQEIKLLELYLSLEKLRFKESLKVELETNGIDDIQVPPMLIQPFIENALLHGLLHKEGVKKLKIEFKLDEVLICEITDNGIGREKAKEIKERQRSEHESFAISAIKKRFDILEKHFEGDLGFEYVDLKDGETILGTKVILKIPLKHSF